MATAEGAEALLTPPSSADVPAASRSKRPAYTPLSTFVLPKGENRHYVQQYADMYFLRLAQVKPAVEQNAQEHWKDFKIASEKARQVERVLDVRQGQACWVVGTIFMNMPLKPNILDDISKDHWISAPPGRDKYISADGTTEIMLEDESGRLRLTGDCLEDQILVTGAIVAALGTENSDGVFNVVDTIVADLPRQPERWELEDSAQAVAGKSVKKDRPKGGKIAIISGLQISGTFEDSVALDLLGQFLLGELGGDDLHAQAADITRLIIAGDSLANASPIPSREELAAKKGSKKYGYDASSYNPAPSEHLDNFLAEILETLPVTLIPGASDPANVQFPQQPLHPALFPRSRMFAKPLIQQQQQQDADTPNWFDSVTNPWEGEVDGWRFLGCGGQPVNDVFKYVDSDDRLHMMECMLRWRCNAPTAPDTLWCYPFQDDDPLLIKDCPHVYFAGNQPYFGTQVIKGPADQEVRLIAVPKFKETGKVVLVDAETLDAQVLQISLSGNGA